MFFFLNILQHISWKSGFQVPVLPSCCSLFKCCHQSIQVLSAFPKPRLYSTTLKLQNILQSTVADWKWTNPIYEHSSSRVLSLILHLHVSLSTPVPQDFCRLIHLFKKLRICYAKKSVVNRRTGCKRLRPSGAPFQTRRFDKLWVWPWTLTWLTLSWKTLSWGSCSRTADLSRYNQRWLGFSTKRERI